MMWALFLGYIFIFWFLSPPSEDKNLVARYELRGKNERE